MSDFTKEELDLIFTTFVDAFSKYILEIDKKYLDENGCINDDGISQATGKTFNEINKFNDLTDEQKEDLIEDCLNEAAMEAADSPETTPDKVIDSFREKLLQIFESRYDYEQENDSIVNNSFGNR
jgi:hypothetical protein